MPNPFFEKLVNDRRDGLAPGQTPDVKAVEPESFQVDFYPAPFDGLSTCGRCLVLLVTEYAPSHKEWHRKMGG